MIDAALTYVASLLDGHLAGQANAGPGPHAALAALVDRAGPLDPEIAGRIVLTLIGVERAQTGSTGPAAAAEKGRAERLVRPEPLHLNLHLLVTATLDPGAPANGYAAALARLSAALGFFRSREVMTPETAPGLPEGIERLVFELATADRDAQAALWNTLGGGYLPSVLYRVRMLPIPAEERLDLSAPVTRIGLRTRRPS